MRAVRSALTPQVVASGNPGGDLSTVFFRLVRGTEPVLLPLRSRAGDIWEKLRGEESRAAPDEPPEPGRKRRREVDREDTISDCELEFGSGPFFSITHREFLSQCGQFIQCLNPPLIRLLLKGHQIAEQDAAMRAHLAGGDLASIQQLDQKWPGNTERFGGLLGRQFRVDGNECDSIACGHFREQSY